MTEQADHHEPAPEGGRRRKRRSLPGCLAVLVALAIVVGGFYVLVSWGVGAVKDRFFENAADYAGPGRGKVTFEVVSGDVAAEICRNLKAAKVVASVDACLRPPRRTPTPARSRPGSTR
jgi:UPF0755 protein